jgi:hypothetical protein
MEPTPPATLEGEHLEAVDIITRMMLLGLYEHINELLDGYPYEVEVVDRWGDDIFVVYYKILLDVFRVLQIPRKCHETFTRFCTQLMGNGVQNCYLKYVGRTDDGKPVLKIYGGGFHVYMS